MNILSKLNKSIVTKISLGMIIPIVIYSLVFSYVSYSNSNTVIEEILIPSFEDVLEMRMDAFGGQIDADLINKAKTSREHYEKLLDIVNNFQEQNNLELVYIMSKINGEDHILVLNGADEYLTPYGFTQKQNEALETQDKVQSEIYEDEFGVHKSIFLSVPGTDSILGIDIDAMAIPQYKESVVRNSVILSLLFIIIGTITGIFLAKRLSRPLLSLVGHIKLVAKGDLSHELKTTSTDEVGQLITHFNEMKSQLKHMIQQITQFSDNVAHSSNSLAKSTGNTRRLVNDMSKSIQEVASGNETVTRSSEDNSKSLEEMSLGIRHIAESSADASDKSHETAEATRLGNEAIIKAEKQMDSIFQSVSSSTELVDQMNVRMNEVNSIIDFILGISGQINLLSLNAAIEAARAGDTGRGFAVVASEIRKLAEQTANSAGKITETVAIIQNDSHQSTSAMRNVVEEVNDGVVYMKEAGVAFGRIERSIDEVAEKIESVSAVTEQFFASAEEIASAAEETVRVTNQTMEVAKSMEEVSREYVEIIEQTAKEAAQLEEYAASLQELVVIFKV